MAEILDPGYHEFIRGVLGVTKEELPDEEIDNPYVLEYSEKMMARYLPDWDMLDEEDGSLQAFKRATALYVAALCVPRLRLRLAQFESDNKTLFKRWNFMDWPNFESTIWAVFAEAVSKVPGIELPSRELMVISAPAVDVITGE